MVLVLRFGSLLFRQLHILVHVKFYDKGPHHLNPIIFCTCQLYVSVEHLYKTRFVEALSLALAWVFS